MICQCRKPTKHRTTLKQQRWPPVSYTLDLLRNRIIPKSIDSLLVKRIEKTRKTLKVLTCSCKARFASNRANRENMAHLVGGTPKRCARYPPPATHFDPLALVLLVAEMSWLPTRQPPTAPSASHIVSILGMFAAQGGLDCPGPRGRQAEAVGSDRPLATPATSQVPRQQRRRLAIGQPPPSAGTRARDVSAGGAAHTSRLNQGQPC